MSWRNKYHTNTNKKKVGILITVILISDKADFQQGESSEKKRNCA